MVIKMASCKVHNSDYGDTEDSPEEPCWVLMEENGYVDLPVCENCLLRGLEELRKEVQEGGV